MANDTGNNIKLGAFVLLGLFLLILTFYMVGKNRSIFGSDFELKAHFANLNGLVEGSNVLYAGIQAGTVKTIKLINDTTIEVTMVINSHVRSYIHKNAQASIGTEGLMGNKVVNILPIRQVAPLAANGDLLAARKMASTDEMLLTLSHTNDNLESITSSLKSTVAKINGSSLIQLLDDKDLTVKYKSAIGNFNSMSVSAMQMANTLNLLVNDVKRGKGTAGKLLRDTALAASINKSMSQIKIATDSTRQLVNQLNILTAAVNNDYRNGKGTLQAILKDTSLVKKLNATLDNVQKGTDGFNQNMEALKHNFLLKGYFNKLDKQKQAKPVALTGSKP